MMGERPEVLETNLSVPCYVHLTDAGMEQYYRHNLDVKRRTPRDYTIPQPTRTPRGYRFTVHDLMRTFGDKLGLGVRELPFRHEAVTIELADTTLPSVSINVNDDVYVEVTRFGTMVLENMYRGIIPYSRVGELTQMPFHSVANIFGSLLSANMVDPLPIKPTFYIPKPHE